MSDHIEVCILRNEVISHAYPKFVILSKLQKAGIPAYLQFENNNLVVKDGTLTEFKDYKTGSICYIYERDGGK